LRGWQGSASECSGCARRGYIQVIVQHSAPINRRQVVPSAAFRHFFRRAHPYTSHNCHWWLQIVFLSSDSDLDGFNDYFSEMPWCVACCRAEMLAAVHRQHLCCEASLRSLSCVTRCASRPCPAGRRYPLRIVTARRPSPPSSVWRACPPSWCWTAPPALSWKGRPAPRSWPPRSCRVSSASNCELQGQGFGAPRVRPVTSGAHSVGVPNGVRVMAVQTGRPAHFQSCPTSSCFSSGMMMGACDKSQWRC